MQASGSGWPGTAAADSPAEMPVGPSGTTRSFPLHQGRISRLLPLVLLVHVASCTSLGGELPEGVGQQSAASAWPAGQSHLGRYKLTGQLHVSEAPVASIQVHWAGTERSRTWQPLQQPNDTLATSVWSGVDASGRAVAIKVAGHNLHGDDSCAGQPRGRVTRGREPGSVGIAAEPLDGLCLGRLHRLLATRRELELLRALRHPHIARLLGVDMHVTVGDPEAEAGKNNNLKVAFATELAHGSLATLIAELSLPTVTQQPSDRNGTASTVAAHVPEAVIRALLQQIGSALIYLADAQLSFDGAQPPHGPPSHCQWRLKPDHVLLAWDWRRSLRRSAAFQQSQPAAAASDFEPEFKSAPRFLLTGLDAVVPSPAFTGQAWAWKEWNLSPKDLLDCFQQADSTCWPHGPARFLPSIVLRGIQPDSEPPYPQASHHHNAKPWRSDLSNSRQHADADRVPQDYLRELGAMAFALMTAGSGTGLKLPAGDGTGAPAEAIDLQQPYLPGACARPGFAAAVAAALPRVYSTPLRIVVQRLLECSDSSVPGQARLAQHHERRMTAAEAFAALELELVPGQHPHTPDATELDLTCGVHADCAACTGALLAGASGGSGTLTRSMRPPQRL